MLEALYNGASNDLYFGDAYKSCSRNLVISNYFCHRFATLLHATTNYTVDIALAVLLLIGGVIGAQIGTQIGSKMRAEQLRILLSVLVLLVCLKLATDLLIQPSELFPLGQ